jgi:putative FmdB family regulatory protein
MPVYTYRCDACGEEFDHTQRFSDPLLTVCPHCGKETLRKVFTPVSIVFKGSGFYATDHRSPSGATRSSGHSEEKSGTSSSGDGAGESKSEAKSTEAVPTSTTATESK